MADEPTESAPPPEPGIHRSREYKEFRAKLVRRSVAVPNERHWITYEVNSKAAGSPLILIHGTSGTAEYFFRLLAALESSGMRVIATQFPDYWSTREFAEGTVHFMKAMGIRKAHFFGASLGGYLALHLLSLYPTVVESLVLCNAFCDTDNFAQSSWCVASLAYMPDFYLKQMLLKSFPRSSAYPQVVDFVVEQLDELQQEDIASRLTLNCTPGKVRTLPANVNQSRITLLETVDDIVLPGSMRERLHEFLPDAKMAHIKEGGDFPFISRPADVALYILVHLRSHGAAVASPAGAAAESKQGSVAAPRTGSSSSSSSTAAAAPFPSTTRIPNSVSDLKRPDKGSQAEARSSGASTSETKSNPEGSGPAQNPAATDAPKSKPPASALDGEVDDEVWDALGLGGARGAPAKAGTGEGGKHASAVEGSAAKKTDVAADLDLDVSLDLNTV